MVRVAVIEDIVGIVDIYNQAIDARFQTGFTEHVTVVDRRNWFEEHDSQHPILVFKSDGVIAGWLSISPYRSGRNALRFCTEISYFVHEDHKGKGIGSSLLTRGLETAKNLGYTSALAIIIENNVPSVRLVEKFDFKQWGYLPEVVNFDGIVCGHLYYGKKAIIAYSHSAL